MVRIGDFKAQDTITKALYGKDENAVNNNKAAILQETVQKAEVTNGKPANTSQPTANPEAIFVATGANSVNPTGGRTSTHKTGDYNSSSSKKRAANELAKLLQGANVVGTDDGTFEQVVHSAKTADKAIAFVDDKHNPLSKDKKFVAEQNKSVFIASGLVTPPKDKSKKTESTDSTDLDNLPNFSELIAGKKPNNKSSVVTYSPKGKIKEIPLKGENIYYSC